MQDLWEKCKALDESEVTKEENELKKDLWEMKSKWNKVTGMSGWHMSYI